MVARLGELQPRIVALADMVIFDDTQLAEQPRADRLAPVFPDSPSTMGCQPLPRGTCTTTRDPAGYSEPPPGRWQNQPSHPPTTMI